MPSIEQAYVLPEDAAAGVRSLVILPAKIRVDFCPADHLRILMAKMLHGYVPAAYALLTRQPDGSFKVREGETDDLFTRMQYHLSARRTEPFDAVLWFSGPSVTKEIARGVQFLMGEVLEANGFGETVPSNAEHPREIVWEVARRVFIEIRALTRRLGYLFFEPAPGTPPTFHLHLEVEDRPWADAVWDYDGPYASTVAQFGDKLYLLTHSQIRARTVPSARKAHVACRQIMKARRLLIPGPPGMLVVLRDLPFPSLDAAGKFIRGDLSAGRRYWVPRYPRTPGC